MDLNKISGHISVCPFSHHYWIASECFNALDDRLSSQFDNMSRTNYIAFITFIASNERSGALAINLLMIESWTNHHEYIYYHLHFLTHSCDGSNKQKK